MGGKGGGAGGGGGGGGGANNNNEHVSSAYGLRLKALNNTKITEHTHCTWR